MEQRTGTVAVRRIARDGRAFAGVLVAWTVLWVAAGVFVYQTVRGLEDYGKTTVTASRGLSQTSRGLVRAASGLRDTGTALDAIPFVGGDIGDDVRRTAADVDRIAATVRVAARQARTSGEETRDAADDVALVLGTLVAIVPTLPVVLLALAVRPLLAAQAVRP